jgi:hypothetical protein
LSILSNSESRGDVSNAFLDRGASDMYMINLEGMLAIRERRSCPGSNPECRFKKGNCNDIFCGRSTARMPKTSHRVEELESLDIFTFLHFDEQRLFPTNTLSASKQCNDGSIM